MKVAGSLGPAPADFEPKNDEAAATAMVKLRIRLPPFASCSFAEGPARAGISHHRAVCHLVSGG